MAYPLMLAHGGISSCSSGSDATSRVVPSHPSVKRTEIRESCWNRGVGSPHHHHDMSGCVYNTGWRQEPPFLISTTPK
jgi:hypothetical protein